MGFDKGLFVKCRVPIISCVGINPTLFLCRTVTLPQHVNESVHLHTILYIASLFPLLHTSVQRIEVYSQRCVTDVCLCLETQRIITPLRDLYNDT